MISDRFCTTNLQLRPFAEADGPAVFAYWESDPDWEKFNLSVPENFSAADARAFVADMAGRDRQRQPNWALVHEDHVVGIVSITFAEDFSAATIGYGIHADLRGRGLCVEAVQKVLSAAFREHSGLAEVFAHTDAANRASMRVLEKLGFSQDHAAAAAGVTFRLLRSGARPLTCPA